MRYMTAWNADIGATATTRYIGLGAASGSSAVAVTDIQIPTAMTVISWYVELTVAPGATYTRTFDILKNGTATAQSIVISNTGTTGSFTGTPVSFADNDTISVRINTSSTSAATGYVKFGILMESAAGQILFAGSGGNQINGTATRYIPPQGAGILATVGAMGHYFSVPGTLSRFRCNVQTTPAAGKTWIFKVFKNGAASAITATISNPAVVANDLVNTTAIVPGDIIITEVTSTATPTNTNARTTMLFTPSNDGESVYACMSSTALSTTVDNYLTPTSSTPSSPVPGATENITEVILPINGALIKNFRTAVTTAPSSGKTRVATLRVNNADSAITATISNTATSAEDSTNRIVTVAGSKLSVKHTPTGTPSASGVNMTSFVLYISTKKPQIMPVVAAG